MRQMYINIDGAHGLVSVGSAAAGESRLGSERVAFTRGDPAQGVMQLTSKVQAERDYDLSSAAYAIPSPYQERGWREFLRGTAFDGTQYQVLNWESDDTSTASTPSR